MTWVEPQHFEFPDGYVPPRASLDPPTDRNAASTPAQHRTVTVYAVGLVHASVCADATDDELDWMLGEVNIAHPTGVGPWQLSNELTFASGQPNPCPCEQENGHRHFLLEC